MNAEHDRDGETKVLLSDHLFDGSGGPVMERPAVTIRGDRIIAVEQRGHQWRAPESAEVISFDGSTLLPGLIDSHVHLAYSGEGDTLSADEHRKQAVRNATAALAGGVTTVRDLGSRDGAALLARDAVRSGSFAGPRILACERPITTPGGHLHWFGRQAAGESQLHDAVNAIAEAGADVVKLMVTGGNSTPSSDPYTPQYTVEEVRAVVTAAHLRGMRVAAHVLCSAGVHVAVAGGVDTIEHGWTITGKKQDYNDAIASEVAMAEVSASVTAHESLRALYRTGAQGDLKELRRRLHPHRGLRANRVPVLVHSDAGPSTTTFDGFAESVAAYSAGMEVGVSEAIAAATSLPAAALGLADEIGSVTPGNVADLLVVAGDLAHNIGALRQVEQIFIAGNPIE